VSGNVSGSGSWHGESDAAGAAASELLQLAHEENGEQKQRRLENLWTSSGAERRLWPVRRLRRCCCYPCVGRFGVVVVVVVVVASTCRLKINMEHKQKLLVHN